MGADGSGDAPDEGSQLTGIDEARRRIAEAARIGATAACKRRIVSLSVSSGGFIF